MKKISIYLHQDIINTLKCFGDITNVINNVIRSSLELDSLYEDKLPAAPNRTSAKRIDVYIEEELLEALSNVRIRPLLYWFVENEIYNELNWEMLHEYGESDKLKLTHQFDKTINELSKLNKLCNNRLKQVVDDVICLRSEYEIQ